MHHQGFLKGGSATAPVSSMGGGRGVIHCGSRVCSFVVYIFRQYVLCGGWTVLARTNLSLLVASVPIFITYMRQLKFHDQQIHKFLLNSQ
jgi:hypothetical protein